MSGEDSSSMIPEALRKEINGYPLWQILLVVVVLFIAFSKMGVLPATVTNNMPKQFQPTTNNQTEKGAYYY